MAKKDLGKTSIGMQPELAALLSYLFGFITGLIFYVIEKKNKYVRFHAMQSMLAFGALFVIAIILPFIPVIGLIMVPFLWLAQVILWIIMMIKAYQGEMLKLPVVGDMAEKNS